MIENLDDLFKNGIVTLRHQQIIENFYDSLDDYGKSIVDNLVGIAFNVGQLNTIKRTKEEIEKITGKEISL